MTDPGQATHRDPWLACLWSVLTLGAYWIWWHLELSKEVADAAGRQRTAWRWAVRGYVLLLAGLVLVAVQVGLTAWSLTAPDLQMVHVVGILAIGGLGVLLGVVGVVLQVMAWERLLRDLEAAEDGGHVNRWLVLLAFLIPWVGWLVPPWLVQRRSNALLTGA